MRVLAAPVSPRRLAPRNESWLFNLRRGCLRTFSSSFSFGDFAVSNCDSRGSRAFQSVRVEGRGLGCSAATRETTNNSLPRSRPSLLSLKNLSISHLIFAILRDPCTRSSKLFLFFRAYSNHSLSIEAHCHCTPRIDNLKKKHPLPLYLYTTWYTTTKLSNYSTTQCIIFEVQIVHPNARNATTILRFGGVINARTIRASSSVQKSKREEKTKREKGEKSREENWKARHARWRKEKREKGKEKQKRAGCRVKKDSTALPMRYIGIMYIMWYYTRGEYFSSANRPKSCSRLRTTTT